MIIGLKDFLKLAGISVVCFCAVFVCTFFLNFHIDVSGLTDIPEGLQALYNAQLATAQFTCAISGGFLAAVAVAMLLFYIRLYINGHSVHLGTLKAMGYSNAEIALRFWVFGLSVLLGTGLGYAAGHAVMPYIYDNLLINGLPEVAITYHPVLLFALVVAPTVLYSLLSCLFAYLSLKKPVAELLGGKSVSVKIKNNKSEKERPFLTDMLIKSVTSKKALAFFVALGAFCFSAMVQMAFSMKDLSADSMAEIILIIGLTLAVVALFMAITSLVNANAENVAIMRAFGYNLRECAFAVFGGFVPFAFIGFGLGTAYQYGLLTLMVNLVFKDVAEVPYYSFKVPLFFITLAAFIVFFAATLALYLLRLKRISVKRTAEE